MRFRHVSSFPELLGPGSFTSIGPYENPGACTYGYAVALISSSYFYKSDTAAFAGTTGEVQPGQTVALISPSRCLQMSTPIRWSCNRKLLAGHSQRIPQLRYETRSGQVYELYLSPGSEHVDFEQERIDFSNFLARCAEDPVSAAESLAQDGMEQVEARSIASRYGRQIRRLNLDLKQERERRILEISHDLESDLLDSSEFPESASRQIRGLLDILIPDLSAVMYQNILQIGEYSHRAGIEININQQMIGTLEGTVVPGSKRGQARHIDAQVTAAACRPPSGARILKEHGDLND
jgi:hypothetical protein